MLGSDKTVDSISTGGFFLDIPFTSTGLRELAKMDGAIVLDRDATRILHAAVHLMPDPSIPSDETGTRHRTADRVARQTGFPVISVSQSMQIIAVYVGGTRYVLEDSGAILSRANQALATLERYKLRLDEVSSTLSALEIEDLVTTRDVAVVAQRLEMVTRIASEIEDYVLELGSDGRLLSLQLDELVTGVDNERELVIRDYLPTSRRKRTRGGARRDRGAQPDRPGRRRRGRPGARPRRQRAPRRRRHPARLPAAGQGPAAPRRGGGPAGRALRQPAEAALGQHRRPAGRRRRRRAPGPQRARGPLPAGRVQHPRALRLSARSERPTTQRADFFVGLLDADGDFDGDFFGFGVAVTVGRTGVSSLNCSSTGAEPKAAATAWYQPGSAHVVDRVQSLSERWPLHATSTVAGVSLRTTTDSFGTAPWQSCVDQMRSEPLVTLTTSECAETSKSQAWWTSW